jgi:hypothetical protein
MLSHAVKYQKALKVMVEEHHWSELAITTSDWDDLGSLCGIYLGFELTTDVLEPFQEVTLMSSGTNYVTLSDATMHYAMLHGHITQLIKADPKKEEERLNEYLKKALKKLEKYYDNQAVVASIATILDPTKNLKYIEHDLAWDSEWVATIKEQLMDAFNTYEKAKGNVAVETVVEPSTKRTKLDHWRPKPPPKKHELEEYFALPQVPEKACPDVLLWWKNVGQRQFPILCLLARDYLAAQTSRVASEQVFSAASDLITPDRNRLKEESIRASMCLKYWLQNPLLTSPDTENTE